MPHTWGMDMTRHKASAPEPLAIVIYKVVWSQRI